MSGFWILLLIALILVTGIAATLVYCIALILSLGTRRWQPGAAGLLAGAVTLATTTQFSLPAPVQVVLLPIVAAALTTVLMFRKQDWEELTEVSPQVSTGEYIAIFAAGLIGLGLGIVSGIGKPVLVALNQDVVGVMASEKIEIAVAGGFVGASLGVVLGILAISALWPRRDTSEDCRK